MDRIALIGTKGFVGSALLKALSNNSKIKLTSVTRENYNFYKKKEFDIVINSAMPSGRFFANNHPRVDFGETVLKTANIIYGWKYKKFVQISTISARTELDNVYGRHKAAAEKICNFGDNLIVRLTSMFGPTLQKGVLIDLLEGKDIFVDKNSRYSFASLEFVTNWISLNLNEKGIIEVGAKNSISIKEIMDKFKLKSKFSGKKDIQIVKNPRPEFPDADEVFKFMKERTVSSLLIDKN